MKFEMFKFETKNNSFTLFEFSIVFLKKSKKGEVSK